MANSPADQNSFNTGKAFLSIAIVFGLSLLFFMAWMSQIFNLSLSELIVQFKNCLYYPNMNKFIIGEIGDKNVLMLFYWFLFFTTLLLGIYYMLFIYSPDKKQSILFSQIVPLTFIAGLLIFSVPQQFHRYDNFIKEKGLFGGKTVDEKSLAWFGGFYQFPQIVQNALKSRHQGEFITDRDLSKSPYMFHHRILSYFFYPKVSLRFDNQTPKDVLFLYDKENPLNHIPENYEILFAADDKSFVFAVERQALK